MRHRSITRPVPFRGNARFDLLERIGSGGMGIVYRALDRERGTEVALKTLASESAKGIFRFKQEFRALADVAHPNLISLHELFFENNQWFFTMELVDGVDFLDHVNGRVAGPGAAPDVDTGMQTVVDRGRRGGPAEPVKIVATTPPLAPAGIGRLRNALRQLVAGLMALHESGHLHDDIKPSNVIVTGAGRVVVLDFGVVAALAEPRAHDDDEIVGTPAYMAPERATDAAPTAASDWYAVGVMLYHALAGRLPFTGSDERILREKMCVQPSPVRLWRPDVPEDLDRLCMALLNPKPELRPTGAEVLARLGGEAGVEVAAAAMPFTSADAEVPLVGRERELGMLAAAFERVRGGEPSVVHVYGTSGMGKSALVRAFLDQVRCDPRAVVLAGRCYERESVPYKAVDTVVDALCQHLLGYRAREVAAIAPADAALLGTLFPVLRRIDAFAGPVDEELLGAPHRLRRRAFRALRTLLVALAAERPVVIFIDDLQWGDADSAALLDAILEPPDAPALLLLGCYRPEESQRSGFLSRIAGRAPVEVSVRALPPEQALAVAQTLLGDEGRGTGLARALATESGGNPFFLHELVRFVAVEHSRLALPSLDALIERRVDRLGEDGRGLLEAIAVAGRPIEQRAARIAAGIAEGEWPALVQRAAVARLLRISGSRTDDLIECYHDRIREAVTARLATAELARYHRALAVALEDSYRRDPQTVAEHFASAGDPERAAYYALQAADLAAAALAFDRAAFLYRRALELDPRTADDTAPTAARALLPAPAGRSAGDDRLAIRIKLASALVSAGRGADAAAIYLDVAGTSSGDAALELRRLAAEHFLRSGHVDQGIEALRAVLPGVGLSLPGSARRSVPGLLWRRLRLRLRGLEVSAPGATSADHLARMEVCRTANLGLSLFDPVRAAVFSTRHLHLALDSGDPYRISFALAIEAGFMSSAQNPARANQLLDRAEAIARQVGHPLLIASAGMIRGILAYERGDFRGAFLRCEETEELVRRELTGMTWELRTLEMFSIHSLFFLGEFAEILRRVPRHIADARDRGDLYAIMYLRSLAGPCMRAICDDDVAAAEAEIAEVEEQFPGSGFFLQHLFLVYARTFLDMYIDDPVRAHRRLRESRPSVRGSMLLHDRSVRVFWNFLVGTTAVGAAAHSRRDAPRLLRTARGAARTLTADGAAPHQAMGRLIHGGAAHVAGRAEEAAAHLGAAADGFDTAHMTVFAACARRRLGQVVGGTRGDQLVAASTELLSGKLVLRPERGALCLAPGFAE